MAEKLLAAIRVRGVNEIKIEIEDTLKMVRLYRKNFCVVLPENTTFSGMLKRAKDYITWGEINTETLKEMVEKRGEQFKGDDDKDAFVFNGKKYRKFFRLSPPRKGFGNKGIKNTFASGGALGYRGDKINELIKRML